MLLEKHALTSPPKAISFAFETLFDKEAGVWVGWCEGSGVQSEHETQAGLKHRISQVLPDILCETYTAPPNQIFR